MVPSLLALALAIAPASAQEVAVLGSPSTGALQADIRDALLCTGSFVRVDMRDVALSTPTLAELQQYHAVLVWSDLPFADPEAFGDVLADYVDAGGGLVVAVGALTTQAALGGRLVDGYLPTTTGPLTGAFAGQTFTALPGFAQASAIPAISGHPVLYGVNTLSNGAGPLAAGITEVDGATRLAEWSNGTLAVATLETVGGEVVALNLFPPSSSSDPALWTGDGDRLLANSLVWSAGFGKPPTTDYNTTIYQDLNCNGLDVADEPLIDETDPVCLDNLDPATGEPFPTNDTYFDYFSYGCDVLVPPSDDVDGDLLTGFVPPFGPGIVQVAGQVALLVCDNCSTDFNPDQADMDVDGVGDLCDNCPLIANNDQDNGESVCPNGPDGDCHGTACDNCPCVANVDQSDVDADGVGDLCDNCLQVYNPDQFDGDLDFAGDACDTCPEAFDPGQGDVDFDGVGDLCDVCVQVVDPAQLDADADGRGDACDVCPNDDDTSQVDGDGDGVGDDCDVCPGVQDPDQADGDLDGVGDACDNCAQNSNADQSEADGDGLGDACDSCPSHPDPFDDDGDGDGVGDLCDDCVDVANPDQADRDADGAGDACDTCPFVATALDIDDDGDGYGDACDVCPVVFDPDQADADGDGLGDACDTLALRGGGEVGGCATAPAPSGLTLLILAFVVGASARRREV